MSLKLTYQKNTKYAFTLEAEFKKSAKLGNEEKVVYKTKVRFYSPLIFTRLGYCVLTNKRVFFIKHYLFRPDILVSISLDDISSINLDETNFFNCSFPLRKYFFITLNFLDKKIRFYKFSGMYSKHWRPSNVGTKRLYKRIAGKLQSKK